MNRWLARIPALLALLSLPTAVLAEASKPCLSPGEAKGLVQIALPDLITTVSSKCKTSLPPQSFLILSGSDLATRYRSAGSAAWPAARSAFLKLAGPNAAILADLPDEAMKSLLTVGLTSALTSVKPQQCITIDRGIAALAPLPAENVAELAMILMEMGGKGTGKTSSSPFSICPAQAPSRPAPPLSK